MYSWQLCLPHLDVARLWQQRDAFPRATLEGLCLCDCFTAVPGNFKYNLNMKICSCSLLMLHPYVISKKKNCESIWFFILVSLPGDTPPAPTICLWFARRLSGGIQAKIGHWFGSVQ